MSGVKVKVGIGVRWSVRLSGELEMNRECSFQELMLEFHSIPFQSIPFHSIPFHSIPIHSIPFHSMFYPMPENLYFNADMIHILSSIND